MYTHVHPCLPKITQYFTLQVSDLFQSHVYDFAGSFVCTKTVIAVFLTALEGRL